MASLALMVSIIVIAILISGPLCWIISKVKCIPNIIVYIIAVSCIAIGVWFILLPIPAIKYIGLIPIYFGYISFSKRYYATI